MRWIHGFVLPRYAATTATQFCVCATLVSHAFAPRWLRLVTVCRVPVWLRLDRATVTTLVRAHWFCVRFVALPVIFPRALCTQHITMLNWVWFCAPLFVTARSVCARLRLPRSCAHGFTGLCGLQQAYFTHTPRFLFAPPAAIPRHGSLPVQDLPLPLFHLQAVCPAVWTFALRVLHAVHTFRSARYRFPYTRLLLPVTRLRCVHVVRWFDTGRTAHILHLPRVWLPRYLRLRHVTFNAFGCMQFVTHLHRWLHPTHAFYYGCALPVVNTFAFFTVAFCALQLPFTDFICPSCRLRCWLVAVLGLVCTATHFICTLRILVPVTFTFTWFAYGYGLLPHFATHATVTGLAGSRGCLHPGGYVVTVAFFTPLGLRFCSYAYRYPHLPTPRGPFACRPATHCLQFLHVPSFIGLRSHITVVGTLHSVTHSLQFYRFYRTRILHTLFTHRLFTARVCTPPLRTTHTYIPLPRLDHALHILTPAVVTFYFVAALVRSARTYTLHAFVPLYTFAHTHIQFIVHIYLHTTFAGSYRV